MSFSFFPLSPVAVLVSKWSSVALVVSLDMPWTQMLWAGKSWAVW